ncbi:MAG: hypothetical protein DPW16_16495 [Chloroflexi bacterium]|nr:hypothetical protein [Chloroflexota bacterium]
MKISKTIGYLILGLWFQPFSSPSLAQTDSMNHYHEVLQIGRGTANDMEWNPNGQTIAIGGSLGIWIYDSGFSNFEHLVGSSEVVELTWSSDGRRIATSNNKTTIQIWDLADEDQSNSPILMQSPTSNISRLSWSSDGSKLAAGSWNGDVFVWDAQTGEFLNSISGIDASITSIEWDVSNEKLLLAYSSGNGGGLYILNISTGDLFLLYSGTVGLNSATWDVNSGRIFFSSEGRGVIQMLDLQGERNEIIDTNFTSIDDFKFSADGEFLAVVGYDGRVEVWNFSTRQVEGILESKNGSVVKSISWNPNGENMVGIDLTDTIFLWSVTGQKTLLALHEYRNEQLDVEWSPDNTHLASVDSHGIHVFDSENGQALFEIRSSGSFAVAWSPDNTRLVTPFATTGIVFWDATTGQFLNAAAELPEFIGYMFAVAWSPNGEKIAGGAGAIAIWEADSDAPPSIFYQHGESVTSMAWSPDSKYIGTTADGILKIWDVSTGEILIETSGLRDIAWNPDGAMVAVGGGSGIIRIIDVHSGESLRLLQTHQSDLFALAWNPDGTSLASAHADGTIVVWDLESERAIDILQGHADIVTALDWDQMGDRLVSASIDGTIRIWSQ